MKQNSNVPAFLTKLWTLVGDADTNEFICWSQDGNSFLVLDEQRFAKEILPKFFKHNNMASFIRQLNMCEAAFITSYSTLALQNNGFRKVMYIDTGIVKQERDGPVEFQHPYFRHGQDDLLEKIKRKVSNARPEDSKIRHEDFTKILASVQSVHNKQESIDSRLGALKRENEALWREISDLRQKHAHQQRLIKKLVHFLVTLVQNNHMLNLKRKRPVLMNSPGKKTKYIHQDCDEKVCAEHSSVNSVKGSETSDDIIICNLMEPNAEVAAKIREGSPRADERSDIDFTEVEQDSCKVLPAETEQKTASTSDNKVTEATLPAALDSVHGCRPLDSCGTTRSTLLLNKSSGLILEDPVKMMDSIINNNGAITQNINLLGKVELMDYLDSIDCSLEDFQAMLYGKQFAIGFDALQESMSTKEKAAHQSISKTEEDKIDKQFIQYTSCPLLTFLDGCSPPPEVNCMKYSYTNFSNNYIQPSPAEDEPPSELLDTNLEPKRSACSSLIRLEPLTEAEASEETLFFLCELGPAVPEASSNQLDK